MRLLFFILSLLLLSSSNPSKIDKNSFNGIVLGITTLKELRKIYPNGKSDKFEMYVMFRTDNGRRCVSVTREIMRIKSNGIEFNITYHKDENEDSVKIFDITFNERFKGKTSQGIGINSNIKEVIKAYGQNETNLDSVNYLDYEWIKFYFNKNRKVRKIDLNYDE